jgi:aminocarboxymuconate-semialdehyde decarboxylase
VTAAPNNKARPKIDAFCHIVPRPVLDRMLAVADNPAARSWLQGTLALEALYDMDLRFRAMDPFGDEYVQVLTLATPPLEQVASGQALVDLARLANDHMAELCQRHPDRFVGFAAALPMEDVDASIVELERACSDVNPGALGAQIFTNVNGAPLDGPRFEPLFARLADLDRTVWVHGARSFLRPDFVGEEESRFGLYLAFGWPYEMGLFMARMVATGVFERYPDLRILTHHGGGIIPSFGQRFGPTGGSRFQSESHEPDRRQLASLKKPPIEYLKMFYADTTISPSEHGGHLYGLETLQASVAFFGAERVLFGSDMPFGPPGGQGFLPTNIKVIERLGLPPEQQDAIFAANARRVLRLDHVRP